MFLLGGFTHAQEFDNVGFENISCVSDCNPANGQMSCVDGWRSFSMQGLSQLKHENCDSDLVCNGNNSILLSRAGGVVGTRNPFFGMDLKNNPVIIDLDAKRIPGHDSQGRVLVEGLDADQNYQLLGSQRPRFTFCSDMSILLDSEVSEFEELLFSTNYNDLSPNDIVVDDIRFGGYLINISDECSLVTIDLASKLNLEVEAFYAIVTDNNGNTIAEIENTNGNSLSFNVSQTGTYFFEIVVFHTVNGELEYLQLFLEHTIDSLENPTPVIVTADGTDISENLTYTIPCGESCVNINATSLQNVEYSSLDAGIIQTSNGQFCVPENSNTTNFIVNITGTDSCGNEFDEDINVEVKQDCCETSVPVNLQVEDNLLSWDPVPGAIGYQVEATPSWPSNCGCQSPVSIIPIQTTDTSVSIPINYGSCTSVQVRAICADGSLSLPSDGVCVRVGKYSSPTTISISPNPNDGEMMFNVKTVYNGDLTIIVSDFYGNTLKTINSRTNSKKMSSVSWDGSHLTSGIYFVTFKTEKEVLTRSVIIN